MRLHCNKHGYLDEHMSPEKPCPHCKIEQLEQELTKTKEDLAAEVAVHRNTMQVYDQQLSRYSGVVEVEGRQYFGRVIYLNQKADLSKGETSVRVLVRPMEGESGE